MRLFWPPWRCFSLDEAKKTSRQTRAAAIADLDFKGTGGRYQLVLAAQPASYALLIDVHGTIPWNEWSMPVQGNPVRVTLELAGQALVGEGNTPLELAKARGYSVVISLLEKAGADRGRGVRTVHQRSTRSV